MAKTSDAQMRATKNYKKKHPEMARRYRYLSYARKYIREMANEENLEEFEQLIKTRRENLNEK